MRFLFSIATDGTYQDTLETRIIGIKLNSPRLTGTYGNVFMGTFGLILVWGITSNVAMSALVSLFMMCVYISISIYLGDALLCHGYMHIFRFSRYCQVVSKMIKIIVLPSAA